MAEKAEKEGKAIETAIGLVVIVSSYTYIQDQLLNQHMLDVLLSVLVFGVGLVFLYKQIK